MLQETPDGLYCPAGGFHIDPWGAVDRAVITHAHGDHARAGSRAYLCAAPCGPLLERRLEPGAAVETLAYSQSLRIGAVTVSFHPAGHILGSDPARDVMAELFGWWEDNRAAGRASVLFCYTLGKAQRILAALAETTDRRVLVHGAMLAMTEMYRSAGIHMLETEVLVERARNASSAGELVLAPLSARGTPWMRRLGEFSDAFASGTMRVRGMRRQRNVDRGVVLSDHADWPALLQTIAEVGASRVLTTHGYPEPLARYLRSQGIDSGVIRTAWEGEAASS